MDLRTNFQWLVKNNNELYYQLYTSSLPRNQISDQMLRNLRNNGNNI